MISAHKNSKLSRLNSSQLPCIHGSPRPLSVSFCLILSLLSAGALFLKSVFPLQRVPSLATFGMSWHIILYIKYFSFCYSRYSPFPSQGCHGNRFSFMKRKKKNTRSSYFFSSVLFSVSFFSSPFLPLHVFVAMVSCRVVEVWQSSHMLSFVLPVSLTSPLTISVWQHTGEGTHLAGFTKHVHTQIYSISHSGL